MLPRYASDFKDRHGRTRIRFRRTGWQTTYARSLPGSVEFTQEYKSWETFGKVAPSADRITPGTFNDLIVRFYKSQNWRELAESTKEQYRGQLERFRSNHGHRPVSTVETRHFQKIFDDMHETPVSANNLRKRMKQLMNFAIRQDFRRDNPVAATKCLKTSKRGFPDWTEAEISQFETYHPVGTAARLAFDLALFTAQRRADIRMMSPANVQRGKIVVTQQKTGVELKIPMHPSLGASITPFYGNRESFILNNKGKPFTADSFGMWFKRRCVEAGIKDKSMHGLRKAAARRLAEVSLSNQMIKSITGHTSDTEVARYTAAARQERMAVRAIGQLDLANLAD